MLINTRSIHTKLRRLLAGVGLLAVAGTCSGEDAEPHVKIGVVAQMDGRFDQGIEVGRHHFKADYSKLDVEFVYRVGKDGLSVLTQGLIEEHPDVLGVIAGGVSPTEPIMRVIDQAQIPIVHTYSYSLAEMDEVEDKSPYFFSILNVLGYIKAAAEFMSYAVPGAESVAIITISGYEKWVDLTIAELDKVTDRVPLKVTGKVDWVTPGDRCTDEGTCENNPDVSCGTLNPSKKDLECWNYEAGLLIDEALGGQQPEILYMPGSTGTYERMMGYFKANAHKLTSIETFVGGYDTERALKNLEQLGMAHGFVGTSVWEEGQVPERVKEMDKRWAEDFRATFNEEPDASDTLGYYTTAVMCDAVVRMLQAGKASTRDLQQTLRETDYLGALGLIVYDDVGLSKYYVARMFQYDAINKTRNVVYPDEAATAELMHPLVPWAE